MTEHSWDWCDGLTDAQLKNTATSGFGVDVTGARWRTAGNLVAKGLGSIEGGAPNGSTLPGLYFNNAEGIRVLNEFAGEFDGMDL
jgi:hypothetical protein